MAKQRRRAPISRRDAVAILAAERINDWNGLRQEHPDWRPLLSTVREPAGLRGSGLRRADFKRAQFRCADLSETDLSGADLSEADLRGANLSGADLRKACLNGVNLDEACLAEVDAREASLRGARAIGAVLSWADLTGAVLQGADLRGANLGGVLFTNADLAGANLSKAGLGDADLSGANLEGTILRGADLMEANLRGAILRRADLSETILSWADLTEADASETDLRKSDLREATLNHVTLTRTSFRQAIVGGTSFTCLDLASALALNDVRHVGPSSIDLDSLIKSKGRIPALFLRSCDVPQKWIEYTVSLNSDSDTAPFSTCFISYAAQDEEFATQLHHDLQTAGIRCWKWTHDARTGRSMWNEIDQAILSHDRLVLLASKHSLASPAVNREIERAVQKEDQLQRLAAQGEHNGDTDVLFPVRVDEYIFKEWEHERKADVTKKVIADAVGWQTDPEKYRQVLDRLIRDLRNEWTAHET